MTMPRKYAVGDVFARIDGYYEYLEVQEILDPHSAAGPYKIEGFRHGRASADYYSDATLDGHYTLVSGPTWEAQYDEAVQYAMTGEIRVTDPDTGGQKGTKPARFDLLPTGALWQIAEHYGKGAEKYEDRNWERGYDWSLSYAALQRHLNAWWGGEDIDAETGSSHLAAAAFHVMALMTFTETHPEKDNRPK